MFFDGVSDFGNYKAYIIDASNNNQYNNTAFLWRLPGSIHGNDSNLNYDWSVNNEPNLGLFGETPMSVAFWVKLAANSNNTNSVPVQHPSNSNSDTWRVIWKSDSIASSLHAGIWVAIAVDAGAEKNYVMMGKGGAAAGSPGKLHRVGTTTVIADLAAGAGDYVPSWVHIACVWNHTDGTINGANGWQMWVNGTQQVNAFDTSNPFRRHNELNNLAYYPVSNHDTGTFQVQYPNQDGNNLGGWGLRHNQFLGFHLADFGYWHASLDNDDVQALYNQGVLSTRSTPLGNFSITT